MAPAAVAAAVARLHVGGAVGGEGALRRSQHLGQVVGVDVGTHLLDRQAFGPHRDAQHGEGAIVVVHAVRAQVVAPDADVGELDGKLELRAGIAERTREFVDRRVVHHHADDALGPAVRCRLDLPLRMDAAHRAVGPQHAVVLRVTPGRRHRLAVGAGEMVFRMDAAGGLFEARRALCRIEAPEVEHVAIPAATSRGDVTLPQAEAAEFLCDVEQFAKARSFGRLCALFADVFQHPGDATIGVACLHAEPAALQRQFEVRDVARLERAGQRAGSVECRDAIAFAQREAPAEGRVAGQQRAVGGRPCHQLARQLEPGREHLRAGRGRGAHEPSRATSERDDAEVPRFTRRVYDARPRRSRRRTRIPTYSAATCSTSLPKFCPLNSLSSVAGKLASPWTTSSLLFMRPSFR